MPQGDQHHQIPIAATFEQNLNILLDDYSQTVLSRFQMSGDDHISTLIHSKNIQKTRFQSRHSSLHLPMKLMT